MEITNQIMLVLGSSVATAFGQWVFFLRKHRLGNDRTEIDNYKLIAQEWRESAEKWKELADAYQQELIEHKKDRMEHESVINKLKERLKGYEDK